MILFSPALDLCLNTNDSSYCWQYAHHGKCRSTQRGPCLPVPLIMLYSLTAVWQRNENVPKGNCSLAAHKIIKDSTSLTSSLSSIMPCQQGGFLCSSPKTLLEKAYLWQGKIPPSAQKWHQTSARPICLIDIDAVISPSSLLAAIIDADTGPLG